MTTTTSFPSVYNWADEAAKVAESVRKTGRSCGSCSLCCRLLDVPQAGKETSQWCPHCRPGKGGCSIYADRPQVCRDWACSWLSHLEFSDEWFPQKCGIVIDMHVMEDGYPIARFHIDPRTPDVWRKEPYYSTIKGIALIGLRADISDQYRTIIAIGTRPWLLVLPNKEIEWKSGVLLLTGPDQWELIPAKSDEAAGEMGARFQAIEKILVEARKQYPGLDPMQVLAHAEPKLLELFNSKKA